MMCPVKVTLAAVLACSLLTVGEALPSSSSSSGDSSSGVSSSSSSSSNSFPVFGTKRYARSNLLPSGEYGGQGLSLPVYHMPNARYYDAPLPPQYFPYAPYPQPSSSDYYDDSGYYGDTGKSYYYLPQQPSSPHRRYQRNNERYTSYGLPTYRGEYKPTPYYYAHGPSYSYSDDHESSNPLDDLHEEMLQEDERERARDYYPVGQEQWYESPSRPDSAFLRNLILYNSQLQNFGGGRGRQLPPLDTSNEEDFEEYDDTDPDYEYDSGPLGDTRSGYGNFFGNGYPGDVAPAPYIPSGVGSTGGRMNAFSKLNSFRNSMAKNQIDEDDEEVQELKSYNAYDYDADEYDDSWSHWDRKRNVQPKKATFAATGTTSSATKSITTTSTTKKPAKVVVVTSSTTVAPAVPSKTGNGQKEVVLPRPTNPRNLFAANLIHAVDETRMQLGQPKTDENSVHQAPKSSKIYDALKAMINMRQDVEKADLRQQLEHQKQLAHIHKRFVSNEESLVQQLDGLKRSA
uniref:Uncharacterized protein n=1 Tax=Anopheles farauti TaxID=69004 RepID=A0A182QIZ5_9DIPT